MNTFSFEKLYSSTTKCYAYYKDGLGFLQVGLILDGLQTSVTGEKFIHVDNFAKRVKIYDILSITDSYIKWVK